MERAEGIFSFSHLTLHEYLTAYHVVQQPDQIQALVEQHLTDDRWREVFLLVAGLLSNANTLLAWMAATIPILLATEKLKALVNWADSATTGSLGAYKPAAKRVAVLYLSLDFYLYLSLDLYLYLSFCRLLCHSLDLSLCHSLDLSLSSPLSRPLDRSLSCALSLDLSLDLSKSFEKVKIFQDVHFIGLTARLAALKARVPKSDPADKIYQEFAKQLVQTWCGALHLQPEWLDLSEREADSLEKYLSANLLLLKCKEAAVRVSRETWAGIEERMLTVEDRENTAAVGAGLAES